jgi:hypothetical protein
MGYYVYLLYDDKGNGYIGKTNDIIQRIRGHRCKKTNKSRSRYFDNFECLVIEEFDDEDSMVVGEDFYIRLYMDLYGDKLLNYQIPLQTQKERAKKYKEQHNKNHKKYAENNKSKVLESSKIYYKNNKDKVKEHQREIIDCNCGTHYTRSNKSQHIKSQKHINFLNLLE